VLAVINGAVKSKWKREVAAFKEEQSKNPVAKSMTETLRAIAESLK
jgi:hypothetical protein